ncbi:MAG: DUF6048 family protein [Bacteroidales bacterium]|jgi:hypothetical protein|nr:DUF6048 family protein [Bacteroidales bacterium]
MRAQLLHPLEEGRSPFVRISVDPTVSLKTFLQEANMYGFEATIDSEIKQNLFLIGGIGFLQTTLEEANYGYNNSGMFGMIGADLNLTKYKSPKDRDIFFVGLHYGFATLSHEANSIVMSNHWGDFSTEVPRESHAATWIEIAMGLKAEAAKNIFIGWTGEAKFKTHLSQGEMIPYNIPGYGKNDSKVAFDISFFVSYAITMKPKKKPSNIEIME